MSASERKLNELLARATPQQRAEIEKITQKIDHNFDEAAARIKTFMAVSNGLFYAELGTAFDKVRQTPYYKQRVKAAFNAAMAEHKAYEARIRTSSQFDTGEFTAEATKVFGTMSREDYFFLWQDIGDAMRKRITPYLNALRHKYRLQLEKDGDPYATLNCYLLTTSTLLAMAVDNYRQIPVIIKYWELPKEVMSKFTFFDPAKILLAWNKAVHILSVTTRIKGHGMTGDEQKNIDMSIQQIRDVFNDENLINECIYDAQQNNEELYRTKGEYKKALRETREIINGK